MPDAQFCCQMKLAPVGPNLLQDYVKPDSKFSEYLSDLGT